jgi:hypothetical protein
MSHSAKIQTKITQLEPLKRALEHFGWRVIENAKARTYEYDPKKNQVYDFVAVNPEQATNMTFDLGIMREENGELSVSCDMWGGSIARSLGQNLETLKGEYAYRVIEQKYAIEGASVFRTIKEDGTQEVDVEFAH